MATLASGTALVDKLSLQHRLFAALSDMFGREVPLYDKSLLVNRATNRAVRGLLAKVHPGFALSDAELERTSGERHGAIRIGRPDEYRWIGRLFGCFAMEPHGFYDMTAVGARSQPIIATAFRSSVRPEHRVFTSLLTTDWFDDATRARIEARLATRRVFSDRAKALVEKCEKDGGLSAADADLLVAECTDRIFKWTGRARDHALYRDLSAAGFRIAADIACFESHHLNHLTPNTFCMDLYTAAMRHAMGEIDAAAFRARAVVVLARLAKAADRDFMKLHFKHVPLAEIAAYGAGGVDAADIDAAADALAAELAQPAYALHLLPHAGFKDFTEGPSEDTPILLRQDAYKALTEPVAFAEEDGSTVETTHTARFGEIEERGYATTPAGRALYDECLAAAEAARAADPSLAKRDFAAYEAMNASNFARFPKSLRALVEAGLVFARYEPTAKGLEAAAAGAVPATIDLLALVDAGLVDFEGLRYEDFLPVSAAGIFASNLQQYGTKSTAEARPTYSQAMLEEILGRPIVDTSAVSAALEAESMLDCYGRLGLLDRVPAERRASLEARVSAFRGRP